MKRTVLKFKMETGDHSNGASPKSLTSRGNLLRTNGAMKKTILGMAISALLILSGSLNAQTKEITGVVEDDQGLLQSASVVIKGTMTGVITGVDGKFSIKAKPSDVLEFALIGYEAKEISVGDQTFIKVKMKEDFSQLVPDKISEITGVVENDQGSPIEHVMVLIKGTTISVYTDVNGKFSIKAKLSDVLEFSFLGYESEEISVGDQTFIKVKLEMSESKKEFNELLQKAERGDATAQNELGDKYSKGDGVAQDYEEAVKWYRKSAEQEYASGQYSLGMMYAVGCGVEQDLEEAVKWFKIAAEHGDVTIQNNVGSMYANGILVKQDDKEALKWFRKSAEQGNVMAQVIVGGMYERGHGVRSDRKTAIEWFRKAAKQGDEGAIKKMRIMGEMTANLICAQSVDELLQKAERGDATAQNELGDKYSKGDGVAQDYEEAVKWYRKSAEQGDAKGQSNLGAMYFNRIGVKRNYKKAIKWFRKSAEKGDARGQNKLGTMYLYGYGVSANRETAIEWFRKAAKQGEEEAIESLLTMGESY